MANKPPRIVIELPPERAEQLYREFLAGTLTKEEAARLYLEFTDTSASLSLPESLKPEDNIIDERLSAIKAEIKDLLVKDPGKAFARLKEKLNREMEAYDDLVTLYARYNRVNRALLKGIIDFQTAEQEFIRIDNAVIFIVNNLQISQLR